MRVVVEILVLGHAGTKTHCVGRPEWFALRVEFLFIVGEEGIIVIEVGCWSWFELNHVSFSKADLK